jgi:hypothetical protein
MKRRIARLLRKQANRLDPPPKPRPYVVTTNSSAAAGNFRLIA